MRSLVPLEITNSDQTIMVTLSRFVPAYYERQSTEHPWQPLALDQQLAKQAIKVIHEAKGTDRRKLQAREGAVLVLVGRAFPDADPMLALKVKSQLI